MAEKIKELYDAMRVTFDAFLQGTRQLDDQLAGKILQETATINTSLKNISKLISKK